MTEEVSINLFIPGTRCLFQPIQSLLQFIHHMFFTLYLKTFWLLNVYIFHQFSIKKS
ncbi:hypothetical protein HanXRQr2_Chr06g0250611 [Helianthus annuus]|uniref:Uncharacterized protein n=1 Tax=Helianthus annuus TaxID=4232 RepID=A0A9K3IRF3_HELAN|nr:hypothetical protein HanXRQr2_Chr06g0250611 [Helianthus annuus]KAJ0566073.1 hypothetical protein HanIR_Chr06g0269721 [Helianthus annuus]